MLTNNNSWWKEFGYHLDGITAIEWFSDGSCSVFDSKGYIRDFDYHLPYDIDKERCDRLLLLA